LIPGVNLLSLAFSVVGTSLVPYRKADGRTQNELRQFVSSYGVPFHVNASVQSVKQSVYRQFNLDWQKQYVRIFVSLDVIDLERDNHGDQFIWGGQTFQLQDRNTWFIQDGWCGALAVAIGPAQFEVPAPAPDEGEGDEGQ
jgi:hypothetical protein